MTYCVALNLADGLVFVSDSRTNAGVDHIATFRKLHVFGVPGERLLVLQSAGNLATSQSVISLLGQRLHGEGAHLHNVPTLFDAARLVGQTLREVVEHDAAPGMSAGIDMGCSFLVGGQIGSEPPALFNLYPQGNFIAATPDTPYFQIGESKYGKSILDQVVDPRLSLNDGARACLASLASTARSNLTVGPPYEVVICPRDALAPSQRLKIEEQSPELDLIVRGWSEGVRRAFFELPRFAWEMPETDALPADELPMQMNG
jgi:putative proteasome-type protease